MKKEVYNFLESDKTEADFFNLSKEDLINLRDYLIGLKAMDVAFLDSVEGLVNEMKEKCPWIEDIAFDGIQDERNEGYVFTSIWIFPTEGKNLIVFRDKNGYYRDLSERMPLLYLVDKGNRELVRRQKELDLIQKELYEIDELGCEFYDGLLDHKKSVSGNFTIAHTPNIGITVWSDSDLLANYYDKEIKSYDKEYLSEEDKEMVLSRIQMKNHNL